MLDREKTEANKVIVWRFTQQILVEKHLAHLADYFAANALLQQHPLRRLC